MTGIHILVTVPLIMLMIIDYMFWVKIINIVYHSKSQFDYIKRDSKGFKDGRVSMMKIVFIRWCVC